MQHVNTLIDSAARSARSSTPPTTSKPWSDSTERLVAALWVRLHQLCGQPWINSAGPLTTDDGKLTRTAATWCAKLDTLTPAEFSAGIHELEHRAERAADQGKPFWPPSYAEFRSIARNPRGLNAEQQYIQRADREHAERRAALPPPSDDTARRRGYEALNAMRDLLGLPQRERINDHH